MFQAGCMGVMLGGCARPTRRIRTCACVHSADRHAATQRAVPTIRALPPFPRPSRCVPPAQPTRMQPNASIFKAYDIRGVVGKTLDETVAEHLGRAFGTVARRAAERAVAVGRDGRLSGPSLVAALTRGLRASGVDVIDLGAVTTPMLYYVAATRDAQGCHSGIQVTGSHNPKDYNGFKMVLAGKAIYGDEIQALRQRMEAEDYDVGTGALAQLDVLAEYRQRIASDCKLARPMKIVVDSGNGIPGASAPSVLRALG